MSHSSNPYRVRNRLCNKSNAIPDETGTLDITVYHKDLEEPLSNALIKVYKISVSGQYGEVGEGRLVHQAITDSTGKIPPVKLSAVNELMDDNDSFYSIAIHHPTHHSAYIFNVEIFPDVATKYDVSLKFMYDNEDFFEFIMQPRKSQTM